MKDMKVNYYTFGEELLNTLLEGLYPGSLLVILGHPGAGKTTFVAKMVYENILKYNEKGVYISLAESKEKFTTFMSRLGLDFNGLAERKLFEYIHMPTLSGQELLESITELLSRKIVEEGYKIATVDSITPILNVLTTDRARSYLHAALYSLASASKGLIVLIADLPYGAETIDLKGLEFIADAIIVFRFRTERGLIARYMEIRKFRGREIPVSQIPFTMIENYGIRTLVAPKLEDIPAHTLGRVLRSKCSELVWEEIPRGTAIGIVIGRGASPINALLLLLNTIIENNIPFGFISFRLPSTEIRSLIASLARYMGLNQDEVLKLIKIAQGLNPSIHTLNEVIGMIRLELEKDIGTLVLHGVEMLYLYYPEKMVDRMLRDLILYARLKGVSIFEIVDGVYTRKQLSRYSIVHEIHITEEHKEIHKVYRRIPLVIGDKLIGIKPRYIYEDEIIRCLFEDKKSL
ncbi:putative circadian clock protein, KaiC [Ignisphaera aggregans DSM 17230]|uniref:Putative circadian clock protein, KaiC n=1 Tax=Ignisphaera aggregans (strain DSM 17230 / JCM 13409 / AQ1.S1) TaxID=583356 RepID=E0SRI4_IGNAA|nr:putative circadian clock protein, KaiC [Ignisphaera aggregans DSM 17230]